MSSVNKAIVIGYLGKDPDIRKTQAGKDVAQFSIATSEHWRDKSTGERREKTEWHRIVVFNEGLIKGPVQYLKKGSRAYVEGALQTRKWTDQGGVERYSTEIVLTGFHCSIQLLDSAERVTPEEDSYGTEKSVPLAKPEIDDEIPF